MVTSYITRTAHISAAHRLHSPFLNDQENAVLYGKCNNPNFHGHNYKFEITVKGSISKTTGMVMNMVDLKNYIQTCLVDPLDHKNLDLDVGYFKDTPSTVENLAVYAWKQLDAALKEHKQANATNTELYRVKIHETERNSVEYYGE
ncbi:PTPS-domain-containing protein, partial [Hesseltinella vesiculosa]